MILDLSQAPTDPIERLLWLSGVKEQVNRELEQEFETCYFKARLQGQLDLAVKAGPYARKRVLQFTRRRNNAQGRTVRWNDGADPTSTAYLDGSQQE